ncbi:hypothetical protein OS189_11170 [Sulfitobacter sp. F26169L]|uniref:hypothetical protein n=1 Tax=Sulfitobacter sp. F26169L TaxID=2996015 RepID=UPI002260E24D|nr:hypothetical protein [Sulfitobacter sp. F26169L]MCX7566900.1 hypothetical protein [Sulfitobacter sp. F26169L]
MHTVTTPPEVPRPAHYIVDPVAFFAALIGGPILFTLLSFWALLIPVAALILGAPFYLLVGTPVLLWYLRHHDGDPHDLGFLAFKVMGIVLVFGTLLAAATGDQNLLGIGLSYTGFGMIFALAWA